VYFEVTQDQGNQGSPLNPPLLLREPTVPLKPLP